MNKDIKNSIVEIILTDITTIKALKESLRILIIRRTFKKTTNTYIIVAIANKIVNKIFIVGILAYFNA